MTARQRGRPSGSCIVCRHSERGRIDYLIASGAAVLAVSRQFKVKRGSLYNHARRHISEKYRRSVLVGPLKNEENLRNLCAENGISVLENLRAIYSGLQGRWLANFEAGADNAMVTITREMLNALDKIGRISGELMPNPANVTNNFFLSPQFSQVQAALLRALMRHPDARADVLAELRALEGAAAAPQGPLLEHRNGQAIPA
jgi:hypothetical protein